MNVWLRVFCPYRRRSRTNAIVGTMLIQADAVLVAYHRSPSSSSDNRVYLIVDEGLFVTDGMLYPFVIAVPVLRTVMPIG